MQQKELVDVSREAVKLGRTEMRTKMFQLLLQSIWWKQHGIKNCR